MQKGKLVKTQHALSAFQSKILLKKNPKNHCQSRSPFLIRKSRKKHLGSSFPEPDAFILLGKEKNSGFSYCFSTDNFQDKNQCLDYLHHTDNSSAIIIAVFFHI